MTLQLEREPGWTCKVTTRFSEKVNFSPICTCVPCRRGGPVEIVNKISGRKYSFLALS